MSMIDISQKKDLYREAIASGIIHLKESTIEQIQKDTIKKGNPIQPYWQSNRLPCSFPIAIQFLFKI
jgi:hypothetical protein